MSKKAEGFSLRFVLINTGNISRKVLSKVLRSFDKNFERLHEDSFSGLKYVFDITDNPKAIEVIAELIDKLPDIFGQGVEIDNSEAVQTARRAKELLDKLAEYKPLAKVEELTEQNYNMIDNVLNNGAEKREQEQTKGRISIKEKLAEKRAVIEQRDKTVRTSPEKETEKKSQREM